MNRPKKSKNKNPLLPEEQEVDERNLIDLEESAEISFEDRVNLYWMENKGFVVMCIIAVFVAVVGFQGARLFMDAKSQAHRAEFADARSTETLDAFAKANQDSPLGGFAALDTADKAYTEGEYAKAVEFYAIASTAFEKNFLQGRALLGQAFAKFQSGDESGGLAQLSAIAANSELPEACRAEAAYHLAVEADVAGRTEEFESYSDQIADLGRAVQWQQRLSFYEESSN